MTTLTQQNTQGDILHEIIQNVEKKKEALNGISQRSFENLTEFRTPYDILSGAVQTLSGITGGSGLSSDINKSLKYFEIKGKDSYGSPEWLYKSLKKYIESNERKNIVGCVIQYTPWNISNNNGTKSPDEIYNVLRRIKNEFDGIIFVVTIVKQMTKDGAENEFGFAHPVNLGFIKSAIKTNLEDLKSGNSITIDKIGAASNEAPTILSLPCGGKKDIIKGVGCFNELNSFILEAFNSFKDEPKIKELYNAMYNSFHAGEEEYGEVLNFLEQVINDPKCKSIGHGIQLGRALMDKNNPSYQQALKLVKLAVEKNIIFEICPTSNNSIKSTNVSTDLKHVIKLIEHGCKIAFSTDDPGLLNVDLTSELELVAFTLLKNGMSLKDIIKIIYSSVQNSIEHVFGVEDFYYQQNILIYAECMQYNLSEKVIRKFKLTESDDDSDEDLDEEFSIEYYIKEVIKEFYKCDVHTHIGALFTPDYLMKELISMKKFIQN
jgi:hypothetical protein